MILSASAVPGNEALVHRTVDNLFKLGANVLYNRIADVHVRGHAAQEELKIVHALVQPRYFVPVHGEYRHMVLHAQIAESLDQGTDTLHHDRRRRARDRRKGDANYGERIEADYVYVDGLGVGDIDHVVLRDRKHLASRRHGRRHPADGQATRAASRAGRRSSRAASSTWTRART